MTPDQRLGRSVCPQQPGPAEAVTRLRADGLKTPWSTMCKAEKPDLNKARDSVIKKKRASTLERHRKVSKSIHLTPRSSGLMKIVPNTETPASTRDWKNIPQPLAMVTTAANGANRDRPSVRHNTTVTPIRRSLS